MSAIPPPDISKLLVLRTGVVASILIMCLPRVARAEDALSFKNESWQEDNHRIRVDAKYTQLEKDFGTDTHLKVMGVIDTITGATPTGERPDNVGEPTPTTDIEDKRKAWNVDLSHQFKRVNLGAGFGVSRESDYVSTGWSLNTVTDFNQKNTNLLVGYGGTSDKIMNYSWRKTRRKRGADFIVGINQLIDPNTSVTANVSLGYSGGYMSDAYKSVSTTRLASDFGTQYSWPENRPESKNKVSLFTGINHNLEKLHAAIDLSYRFYSDSFGIMSHTTSFAWFQKIGEHIIIQPSLRFYRQSAGDFYYYNTDLSRITTDSDPVDKDTIGTGKAPFYSSDFRLSHLQTIDAGLKIIWKIASWVSVDAAYNRYLMRGLDGLTPQDAYSNANTYTFGCKISF